MFRCRSSTPRAGVSAFAQCPRARAFLPAFRPYTMRSSGPRFQFTAAPLPPHRTATPKHSAELIKSLRAMGEFLLDSNLIRNYAVNGCHSEAELRKKVHAEAVHLQAALKKWAEANPKVGVKNNFRVLVPLQVYQATIAKLAGQEVSDLKSLQTMLTAAMQIILFPKEAREAKELLNEMKGKQDEMSSSRNATSPTACREQETRKAPAIAPHPPHHAEETTRSVPIPIVAQPLCSVLPKCCQSSHVVTDRICWALTAGCSYCGRVPHCHTVNRPVLLANFTKSHCNSRIRSQTQVKRFGTLNGPIRPNAIARLTQRRAAHVRHFPPCCPAPTVALIAPHPQEAVCAPTFYSDCLLVACISCSRSTPSNGLCILGPISFLCPHDFHPCVQLG
jgi:hypothetical protein